jgi:hypothetical protein
VRAETAYIDGELCGVDDAGLPSFANTQAATDGKRGAKLGYYGNRQMTLSAVIAVARRLPLPIGVAEPLLMLGRG